ncbi:MAG: response regulator transcription factor [Planctomycetota bacterium]
MTAALLFVEDDPSLRTVLADAFARDGHDVTTAADGDEALATLRTRTFDLLVLDIMLPGPSGLEILRSVREHDRKTPILLLTARSSEGDKVLGLELGADDYITKPFSQRELRARVQAHLRRREALSEQGESQAKTQPPTARFAIGAADVDLGGYELHRDGTTHRLSPTEAAMLGLLWQRRGQVVDRSTFLREVWHGAVIGDRTIDTHLLHLRKKIEADPKSPQHLLTVHGVGYRLSVDA